MNNIKEEKCLICGKLATWIRHTQFVGEQSYCDEHSKLEKSFNFPGDSYAFWVEVKEDE